MTSGTPKSFLPDGDVPGTGSIRQMLLVLVLVGIIGLTLELFFLEHTESIWQWVPFVVLGVGFATGVAMAIRPGRRSVRWFQVMMGLFVATGLLGLFLHYQGNSAFEVEMDSSVGGVALFWRSMRGATPALAPGAMVQLGLLGLILAYRHPATHPSFSSAGTGEIRKDKP